MNTKGNIDNESTPKGNPMKNKRDNQDELDELVAFFEDTSDDSELGITTPNINPGKLGTKRSKQEIQVEDFMDVLNQTEGTSLDTIEDIEEIEYINISQDDEPINQELEEEDNNFFQPITSDSQIDKDSDSIANDERYLTEDRLDKILNTTNKRITFEVSQEYKEKYPDIPLKIVRDIEIFTKTFETIKETEQCKKDSRELELYRRLPKDSLRKRGVIYSEEANLLNKYSDLSNSSMLDTINDIYYGRYLLPIRLPDGDIFTFMGYDPHDDYNKYQIAKTDEDNTWIHQGSMLGNLESMEKYPKGSEVLIVEGIFDAIHTEEKYKCPVIATLGVNLNAQKIKLLNQVKEQYKSKFILVPDYDETGLNHWRVNHNLWDGIFNFNKGRKFDELYNDIDDYLIETPDHKLAHWNEQKKVI